MAAVVRGHDGPRLVAVAAPVPGEGQVRLAVELAGVCRTDVAAARGQLGVASGRVLGHELVGVVDRVGDGVDAAWVGRRVGVDPRLEGGRFLGLDEDGAFAGWVCVPTGSLVALPEGLPARRAAFVEPLAAALAVLRAPLAEGARVGVTGEGRIAELTARVLARAGRVVLREGDFDATDETRGLHDLDALVHTAARGLPSLATMRRGALVIVKSRPAAPVAVDLRSVTERELTLLGAAWGDFAEAAALLRDDPLGVDELLGPVLPLASFDEAFAASEDRKVFLAPER